MTEHDIKRLAAVLAVQAKIEAMKVSNEVERLANDVPQYGEESFILCYENLLQLACVSNDNLNEQITVL